jgi:hypothetical protein
MDTAVAAEDTKTTRHFSKQAMGRGRLSTLKLLMHLCCFPYLFAARKYATAKTLPESQQRK